MRAGRWNGILRELRKLVFGTCCSLGALIGLWTGIWSSPDLDPQGSLGDHLTGMAKPMLAHFGVGLGVGITVGLAVCLTLLKPRHRAQEET
jgi:hypothetical protein